jgi:hypothetical protein
MDNQESILEKLKKDGWTRQFVANEPRLSEAVDLYKETGYEVHLEPIPKADNPSELPMVGSECTTCFDGNEDQYKIIFTRPGKGGPTSNDDLFD